jgi:hypothetical protein
MDPEAKKRWMRNLRSGKYKQGRSYLCKIDRNGEARFCCLGVLADEEVYGDWHLNPSEPYVIYYSLISTSTSAQKWHSSMLPPSTCKRLKITQKTMHDLALMNDRGLSFKTIAKWIEENL